MPPDNSQQPDKTLTDADVRIKALDIKRSFIVQAPAGSGKTELLIQRILKLLAHCNEPEEILSITFTRKAASEMRSRILHTLAYAKEFKENFSEPPYPQQRQQEIDKLSQHKQLSLNLALAVLEQDLKMQWHLLDNPHRLQLKTIDSFCSSIAFQLPVTTQLGGQLGLTEDAYPIYQDASKAFLQSLENQQPWSAGLARIILHMDKSSQSLLDLFANMLARRLQWIPLVAEAHYQNPGSLQSHIEHALLDIVTSAISKIKDHTAYNRLQNISEIFSFCSQNVPEHSAMKILGNINNLDEIKIEDIEYWQAITELLLTNEGSWRSVKGINKTLGFPAESSASNAEQKLLFKSKKSFLQELLTDLNTFDNLRLALEDIRGLPPLRINTEQLLITADLCECLITLLAFLQLSFKKFKAIDFSEVQLKASQSLNPDFDTSDNEFGKPALIALDSKITHVLIDEYQDTSNSQLELLEHLISQWQFQQNNKTLFLVGDPMQSIYRFREANVGIFIQAQQLGIQNIKLIPLHLSTNFRSENGIVNWVNHVFEKSFPVENDYNSGAITYSPSIAFHNNNSLPPGYKNVHCFIHKNSTHEEAETGANENNGSYAQAKHICSQIQKIKSLDTQDQESIAILIRSRNHAKAVIEQLKTANIAYQAVEIDSLASTPHIIDLLNLSSVLLHHGDHLAWFSLFRSSLIGLEAKDLLITRSILEKTSLQDFLKDKKTQESLSFSARNILSRTAPVLLAAIHDSKIKSFHLALESCWLSLGGASIIKQENIQDCADFFDLLRKLETSEEYLDSFLLENACKRLFANQISADTNPVKIMTIHKSKGLEFDHVFIPCLDKTTRPDDKHLLNWDIYHNENNENYLLLAPLEGEHIKKNNEKKWGASLYDFLSNLEKSKVRNESVRLLYVATTRARKHIYLYADLDSNTSASFDEDDKTDGGNKYPALKNPKSSSLLSIIWDHLDDIEFINTPDSPAPNPLETNSEPGNPYQLKRIAAHWKNPLFSLKDNPLTSRAGSHQKDIFEPNNDYKYFFEPTPLTNVIGSLVHRCLKQFASGSNEQKQKNWLDHKNFNHYHNNWRWQLQNLGILNKEQLANAIQQTEIILANCFADSKNIWIFDSQLKDSRCELALAYYKNNRADNSEEGFKHFIVDRTFLKDEIRWIVDYKTSSPEENETLTSFLEQQARQYREQLQKYGLCFQGLEDNKQQWALYFPKIATLYLYPN